MGFIFNPFSGQFDFDTKQSLTSLDDRYVNVTGDTMTGTLTVTGGSSYVDAEGVIVRDNALSLYSGCSIDFYDDVGVTGTGAIFMADTNKYNFENVTNSKAAILDLSNIDTSDKTLTVQNVTGTIALVDAGSVDSRYVAVTGDTMTGQLLIDLGSDTQGIIIQGDASQTANLQEWQDSSGDKVAQIDATGDLTIYGTNGQDPITCINSSATPASAIQFQLGAGGAGVLRINDNTGTQKFQFTAGTSTENWINSSVGTRPFLVLGGSTGYTGYSFVVVNNDTTKVTSLVKAIASQTADLQEWQNSSGSVLTRIDADGYIGIGAAPDTENRLRIFGTVKTANKPAMNVAVNFNVASGGQAQGLAFGGVQIGAANSVSAFFTTTVTTGTGSATGGTFSVSGQNNSTQSVSSLLAGRFTGTAQDLTVTDTTILQVEMYDVDTGTVTNSYGIDIQSPTIGTGNIVNQYGIYINDVSGADTLNYAIYTNDGLVRLGDNVSIGQGDAGVDYTLTFDGETNDGVLTWMEDEDYFDFADTVKTSAGRIKNTTTVNTATYDLLASDDIVHVTYTGTGAVTSLTLPTAQVVDGRMILIKDAGGNAATNNITIDTQGAETIDGAATYVINNDYGAIWLYSDGSNWFVA